MQTLSSRFLQPSVHDPSPLEVLIDTVWRRFESDSYHTLPSYPSSTEASGAGVAPYLSRRPPRCYFFIRSDQYANEVGLTKRHLVSEADPALSARLSALKARVVGAAGGTGKDARLVVVHVDYSRPEHGADLAGKELHRAVSVMLTEYPIVHARGEADAAHIAFGEHLLQSSHFAALTSSSSSSFSSSYAVKVPSVSSVHHNDGIVLQQSQPLSSILVEVVSQMDAGQLPTMIIGSSGSGKGAVAAALRQRKSATSWVFSHFCTLNNQSRRLLNLLWRLAASITAQFNPDRVSFHFLGDPFFSFRKRSDMLQEANCTTKLPACDRFVFV